MKPEIEKCTQPKPKWTNAFWVVRIVLPGVKLLLRPSQSAKLPKGMIDLIAKIKTPPILTLLISEKFVGRAYSPASKATVIDLYLVGCIDYFDESNVAHRTDFCYMYNPFGTEFEPNGDFINCTNGNSAD